MRRVQSVPELQQQLMLKKSTLSETLDRLIWTYQIAQITPGQYFALPWVRLGVKMMIPPYTPRRYLNLSVDFWRAFKYAPSPEEEPSDDVRAYVAKLIEVDERSRESTARALKAENKKTGLDQTTPEINQQHRQEQSEAENVRRLRLQEKMSQAAWLITPAGTMGLMVEGFRCRIDLGKMPDGRLWTLKTPGGKEISGAVKNGRLMTWQSRDQGWVDSTTQVAMHFETAVGKYKRGQLRTLYDLGRAVLDILL